MSTFKPRAFTRDFLNICLKVCVDIGLLATSYAAAWLIRFDGSLEGKYLQAFLLTLPFVILVKLVFLFIWGAYRIFYKYISTSDLVTLLKISTAGSIVAVTVPIWMRTEYSRGVQIIDWVLTILLLGGVRFGARIYREGQTLRAHARAVRNGKNGGPTGNGRPKRVLLYGAGDAGEMISREMTRGKYAETYELVGFLDDDTAKQGKWIHNLEVLGTREDVGRIIGERKIDQIVITIPSARGRQIRELLEDIGRRGAELKILPGFAEIVGADVHVSDIRSVNVEDILGREKVDLNIEAISSYIRGKRILVTGAGGSIGSEICRQLIRFHPAELLLFGRGENSIFLLNEELKHHVNGAAIQQIIGDVINKKKLAGVIERARPEIIFHAGADKHVPLMEMNPDEAVLNNVIGTKNVLEVAETYRIERVVCISTDKAVNPTSIMGCCKRIAEMLVQSGHFKGTTGCAVRFGNVLGSRGSVIPVFQRQIANGGPITITHAEIRRYFMTIPEASQLVIQAGALGKGNDLFLLDMGAPVRIVDLARDMIRLAGQVPDEDIKIEIVGLRPGEKINEELWLPTESMVSTSHEKISRVISPCFDYEMLDHQIRQLTQLAIEMDYEGIVRKLKEIVPEYSPAPPSDRFLDQRVGALDGGGSGG